MKKVIDYIFNGKGLGVKWLFIFSLLCAIASGIYIKYFGNLLIPSVQEVAQQILPIKVVDGKIVTPGGIDRTIKMQISPDMPEISFPFAINTTTDDLDTKNLEPGIYLTRKALYSVNDGKVEIRELTGSFEIPQGDYTDTFAKIVTYVAFISSLVFVFMFFFSFFVLAFVLSLTAHILSKIFGRVSDFDFRMRLSICGIILMYSLKYLISFTGSSFSFMLLFVLIVVFQAIFIYQGLPKAKES